MISTIILNSCKSNSDFKHDILLNKNWKVQSSEKANSSGDKISSSGFQTGSWYDAEVPSTIMGTLIKNNVYKDVFFGKNIEKIPTEQFKKPWWYRTTFKVNENKNISTIKIEFDGIIYRANIWLNGKQIASQDSVFGSYRHFQIDVSKIAVKNKENVLAVEVFPVKPGDFSVGFVDWNPAPPDKNMGIWREVRVRLSNDVSIDHPLVKTKLDTKTLKNAQLTVSCELVNNKDTAVSGIMEGSIENIKFSKEVNLKANEKQIITITPEEFKQLNIENPRVWWTYDLGTPELYKLDLNFKINNKVSDVAETNFGIREIKDYLSEKKYRGFILNGKKILINGGGWVDKLFLEYDPGYIETQIQYVRHMNLNTIRLEGIWGNNQHLFDLCDQYGILVMLGWSCQWEWEDYLGKKVDEDFGGIQTKEDMDLIAKSWEDQLKWLRNHPSVSIWMLQSDLIPKPELEKRYLEIFKKDDPTRPFIASAKEWTSEVTGPTGVKMAGPYEYVPPIYWYEDTANGGAFGFNTETGPGAQVPPIESVRKFIPQESLWPTDNEVWNFHCGRNEFKTLRVYNQVLSDRFGEFKNIEDYCTKAQYLNYESIRPMFEAFAANRYNATGVIQWMLNASWPKVFWQLYDYYLMPNGAFYGTRKACEPLHIQYNYGNHSIMIINKTLKKYDHLKARVRLFNLDMSEKFSKTIDVNLPEDATQTILNLPAEVNGLNNIYFLDLRLSDQSQVPISINQYVLSKTPDVLDYKKSTWVYTPSKSIASIKEINNLPKIQIKEKHSFKVENNIEYVTIELENPTDVLAFFVELRVVKGKSDESVLPVFMEDNYFSLLPKEKRIIKGYFYTINLETKDPTLKFSGFNL